MTYVWMECEKVMGVLFFAVREKALQTQMQWNEMKWIDESDDDNMSDIWND